MKRRLGCLLLALLLALAAGAGAESAVVDLIDHPGMPWHFLPGAPVLEAVFPMVHGTDCCILRCGGQTLMVDAASENQHALVQRALAAMGVRRIDRGFASHPHGDHMTGFEFLSEPLGELLIPCPPAVNACAKRTTRVMREKGVPLRRVWDGETLRLGPAELTVIQRGGSEFTENDRSAMLLVRLGARTLLLTGDAENRAQAALIKSPPPGGMKADIVKYPHHGHAPVRDKLWAMWSPELAIVTAHPLPAAPGYAYLKKRGTPALSTWYGMIRLRTDGRTWVVDDLPGEGSRVRYRYLLVDNDNTMMDFDAAEALALRETLTLSGLPADDAAAACYHRVNAEQWRRLEKGETTLERLKTDRFRLFLREMGREDLDALRVCDCYEDRLGHHAEMLPGALQLLESVRPGMKIALVSNGISRIQRLRLSRCPMTPLLDAVVISEERGVSKPDPAMVRLALDELGCADPAQAVFLGDSLTADIAAAHAAGIDSLWLSASGASPLPTHTVRTLSEAESWLLG